ncbi:hypothetical protein [Moritella viscosa]|uniref:Uncharacterized protein n=1 Tax=Moritella viscosa TaxID=80854 RepID=A0ABY1HDT9_9GAMM|nr:hypothetical protein [Moritella viscosa]SGY93152.1 unnamed protein product [Moritella viscosa]SHO28235.1 unnamed protein product [Moritella viscosa]
MQLKNIHTILNIIIDFKLNTTEVSILQDALLLSQSKNNFNLNRNHLRFKTGEELTKQAISKSIISLENKGILEQISKHGNQIQHKLCEEVFNV